MILTFKVVFQQAQERLVTLERLAPVHSWSARRFVVPTRNIHSKLQTNKINNTHRTHRGGGVRMMSSTGWILWQQTAPFKGLWLKKQYQVELLVTVGKFVNLSEEWRSTRQRVVPIFRLDNNISASDVLLVPASWDTETSTPTGRERVTTKPANRKQPTSNERIPSHHWPALNDKKWELFDILQTTLTGGVERKLTALPSITYAVDIERLDLEKKRNNSMQAPVPNRWQGEI